MPEPQYFFKIIYLVGLLCICRCRIWTKKIVLTFSCCTISNSTSQAHQSFNANGFWKNKFDKWQDIFKLLNSICIMTCMSYSCNVIQIDVSHTLWKLYLKKLFSSLIFWQMKIDLQRCGLFWQEMYEKSRYWHFYN